MKWHDVVVDKKFFRDFVQHLLAQNPIILHENVRSHTAVAVTDLMLLWNWEILKHPPHSLDMSPCNYNLFAKVKEPLRGTWQNTRDEIFRVIGQSIRNFKKNGHADGVRTFPHIWQKVINKVGRLYFPTDVNNLPLIKIRL